MKILAFVCFLVGLLWATIDAEDIDRLSHWASQEQFFSNGIFWAYVVAGYFAGMLTVLVGQDFSKE